MTEPIRAPRLTARLLKDLGDVLHALQRERGCASLYLGSFSSMFRTWLDEQYVDSDGRVERLARTIDGEALQRHLNSGVMVKLRGLKGRLDNLGEERAHIDGSSLHKNPGQTRVINRYTFHYILLLSDLMIEIAQAESGFDNDQVAAWSRLLQWKERMGRERSIGSRGFSSRVFENPEFCERMIALMAEQRSFLQTLMSAANDEQRRILEELCQGDDYCRLEEIHRLIEEDSGSEDLASISAEAWFDLLTRMIDRLHEVECRFMETLGHESPQDKIVERCDLEPGERLVVGAGVGQGYKNFLKAQPIFAYLSDTEVNALMAQARIREFEKGKLLFLQGEPATRLYIIVRGWVKIFNGSESGEETVLQMLSAGDTMLESAVILNVPVPTSAQVVEGATILSIPAPVIRQHLKDNNRFAVNMLANMSQHSQRLIHQIEQSRLRSAKERVGWFLLRSWLDAGGQGNATRFPYDKALVASFLDMRPETFSRTLKSFRAEGFAIEQESIRLPDLYALCEFCDGDLAGQCPRSGSGDCLRGGTVAAVGE